MHLNQLAKAFWLVAAVGLASSLNLVEAQMEQFIGPAMQGMAQMGQMMAGGMQGAMQNLGGPEGLMKIGMAAAQGFMAGAGAGRSGLVEYGEEGSRSGLLDYELDAPRSALDFGDSRLSLPEEQMEADRHYLNYLKARGRSSADNWRSSIDNWQEASRRVAIDDPDTGSLIQNEPQLRFAPQWLSYLNPQKDPIGPLIYYDRKHRVSEYESDRDRKKRPDGLEQRRIRRLAKGRSPGEAGKREEPRFISSKYLIGSPYETKNQASFPTSTSMKRVKDGRGATLFVSHAD